MRASPNAGSNSCTAHSGSAPSATHDGTRADDCARGGTYSHKGTRADNCAPTGTYRSTGCRRQMV
jgi:hypothetical protein